MKLKILLSGSHGFIGSHLKQSLIDEGIEVRLVQHELLENLDILKAIAIDFQPTIIIHMAAYGNLITQTDDELIIQANYTNLFNLLHASRDVKYEMFINFSTSSTLLPYNTMYSATKAGGERLCKAFANKYQKRIVSVQPFTVTGLGEPKEHLIPTLIRSCLNGEKMRFVGSPVHDYIGIDDFIDAIRLITENYDLYDTVQIGTGVKTTNQEVLEIVERVTGKKANITTVSNMRNYDTKDWVADTTMIKSLGWEQKQTIEDVIYQMVYANIKN